MFCSYKYLPKFKFFKEPKVFMNSEPDYDQLSRDRYQLYVVVRCYDDKRLIAEMGQLRSVKLPFEQMLDPPRTDAYFNYSSSYFNFFQNECSPT
ncbi:hypothetical protein DPMN_007552 [Dreissena polymorpha]|uniref:Uncharacterized protein n=1 Tax=Dreissena polymorpha TaxID=45954 RepID=A0A9D4RYT8_DREPO|nr:hypothetical protein DPMN_007552 [Dreissena polymorpha]